MKRKTKNSSHLKIVITGGPSGGKTTLIETLEKELAERVCVVAEAASVLYGGGFPRLSQQNARMHAQRAIYFVQYELENLIQSQAGDKRLIVCDRGSIDGAAYWPKGKINFFRSLQTTQVRELDRYDWVIHLDTAAKKAYNQSNNPLRIESADQAQMLNTSIKKAWAKHPRRLILPHQEQFLTKISLAVEAVKLIELGCSYDEVLRALNLN